MKRRRVVHELARRHSGRDGLTAAGGLEEVIDRQQLTQDQVVAGASSTLAGYPHIAGWIDKDAITISVAKDWPGEPRPIVFLLAVAGHPEWAGHAPAQALLKGIDELLADLEQDTPVTGQWRGRVEKMMELKAFTGTDRYMKFQTTLFELLLARHLAVSPVQVEVEPDESDQPSCDLNVISPQGSPQTIVTVEAYAPHRGLERWHQLMIAAPWSRLTGHNEPEQAEQSADQAVRHPGLTPDAIPTALSQMLTRASFRKKINQLDAADGPTLLAVQVHKLTSEIGGLLTMGSAEQVANAISTPAWAKLPASCQGLLICLTGDAPDSNGLECRSMFIPVPMREGLPERRPAPGLMQYLARLADQ